VIEELHVLFAQFGLPDTIMSDNGSCFMSAEFKAFLKKYGNLHLPPTTLHLMGWQSELYK